MLVQSIQHLTVDHINVFFFFLIGKSHENVGESKDFLVNFVSLWFIFLKKKKIVLVKVKKQKSNKTNKQTNTTAQGS